MSSNRNTCAARWAVSTWLLVTASAAGSSLAPVAAPSAGGAERFEAMSRQLRVTAYVEASAGQPLAVTKGIVPGLEQWTTQQVFPPLDGESMAAPQEAPSAAGGAGPDSPMVLQVLAEVETPSGFIATAPLPGTADGTYVVVHANGTVSALSAEGTVLWNRPAAAFMKRTGRPPKGFHHLNPVVLMGTDPIEPFVAAGEHPFAVGDLTADGVADVAVAHYFVSGVGIAGDGGSQISVLDGRTGEFVWSRFYPGFLTNVLIEGSVLVVADRTGNRLGTLGQNGTTSSLEAWRFNPNGHGASATPAWSLPTDAQWAPWLALEHAGAGMLAAAWTDTPIGRANVVHGHVLRVATETGAVTWSVDTAGYPRILRHDALRGQVVALIQDDPQASQLVGYSLLGLSAADGTPVTTLAQRDAVALTFQVGGGAWIVGALATTPSATVCPAPTVCLGGTGSVFTSGSVQAFDPDSGQTKWTHPLSAPKTRGGVLQPYAMLADQGAASNLLVVASFVPSTNTQIQLLDPVLSQRIDSEIDAIDQSTGLPVWSKPGVNLLMPLFLSSYSHGGRAQVMGASSRSNTYGMNVSGGVNSTVSLLIQPTTPYQMVRTFDVATGEAVQETPLLSDVHGAAGADVNGDGVSDLIVGCESAGVFALDGTHLADENPAVLWRRTAAGPVRKMARADLDGDGKFEVVIAATHAVDVLDAITGQLRYELSYPNELVWTFTLDDLDADGLPDLVVPTTRVVAYKGSTGAPLWTYTGATTVPGVGTAYFSSAAVTSAHDVAVEYLTTDLLPARSNDGMPGNQTVVLIDGATGNARWSHSYTYNGGTLELPGGALAGDGVPGVTGTAVAFISVQTDDGTWQTSRPVVDVYDAATGTLAYSSTYPWVHGNAGSVFVPGQGFEAFGDSPSLMATPDGGILNLYNMGLTDIAIASLGSFGSHAVLTDSRLAVSVATRTGFVPQGLKTVPMQARYLSPFVSGGLALQDLDGDGSDEIISYPWDVDGHEAASYQSGQFGVYPDPFIHGFSVLSVQSPNAAPSAALAATPASGYAPLSVTFVVGATDPDAGDTPHYDLDFGDGTTHATGGAGGAVPHGYENAGSYTATLTVTDGHGAASTATTAIEASSPPPPDTTPDPFTFIERTGVATNVYITGEAKTITGIDAPAAVSVANGQYSIDGGAFTSNAGTIHNGQSLRVRHISASTPATTTITNVTVGTYPTTFKSITSDADRTPEPFDFGSRANVEPGALVESVIITLTGYNTGIPLAPGTGLEYRINGGAWSNTSGTLHPGDTLQVRHTATTTHLGYTKTSLKAGGVAGYFTTRTR
jgi:PKD repeat protein